MEAAGRRGRHAGVVLVPGLLAAGVGALIFVGLDNLTGFGTFSLAVPDLPPFTTPTGAEFLWAIGIGLAAAVVGTAIRRLALLAQPIVAPRRILMTPVAGLVVGVLAVAFAAGTDKGSSEVLFSGQDPPCPPSSRTPPVGRWERSCCSWSARAWPTPRP